MLVIAHRTLPLDAPENSLAGIALAAAKGADMVEIDVRATSDRVPVLCHDPVPWRTLRWPWPLRWTTSARFRRLRSRDGAARTNPPTLAEAAAALPAHMGFAVDVKDGRATSVVIEVLAAAGVLQRSFLWTRDRRATRTTVRRDAGRERAILRGATNEAEVRTYFEHALTAGVQAVSLDESVTTSELVDAAHALGLRVYCWVQTPQRHDAAVATGVDGIVTDWPDLAHKAIATR